MKRNSIDIIIDVLEVAKMGINKTGLVYRTNLNFKLANKYLELLQNQGLVEKRLDKYITTDKGKAFLQKAKEVSLYLEPCMKTSAVGSIPWSSINL
ncbi:Winged helix-turn-helix [uncultured archaeon]|nr:Winged helix-turn-helix [uncultured archaeon]